MFNIYWKRFPFIRTLPTFLVGIIIGGYCNAIPFSISIILILALITIVFLLKGKLLKQSMILQLALFTIGFTANQKSIQNIPEAEEVKAIATILSALEEKEKTYKVKGNLEYYNSNEDYTTTKSILYIQKSNEAKSLVVGDQILIETKLSTIPKPSFSGQFDYNAFMAQKGVYFTAYVNATNWQNLGNVDNKLTIEKWSTQTRDHFSGIIDQYISPNANGLIKAISLGVKADLDNATKTSFTKAGIMHILAVSGLHVGIVWTLIAFLFKPVLKFRPKLKFVVVVFEIILVWLFAIITGFSPSVQRAAFMFSLFSISKLNNLEKDNLNILAASAVILLVIDPKLLFSIGFQLSYSAVAAILLLYPKIYSLFYFKNKILDYCWSIQAVSFAAVIGTTPITVYYFHQFSLVFPITNLLAIPVAFLLVTGTIILFPISKIPFLAYWLGKAISFLACFLINTIDFIANWKFATLNNLYIDGNEMVGMVVLICITIFALYNITHAKKATIISLVCISLLFIYRGSRKIVEYANHDSIELKTDRYYSHCLTIGSKAYTFSNPKSISSYQTNLSGYFKKNMLYKHEHIEAPYVKVGLPTAGWEENYKAHTQLAICEP
ncbi:MAG: ComEC/Rec2 family competence protein [Chitinophagales bacterium]